MDSFEDTISFWATVLGTLVAFFGVFQSDAWVAAIGTLVTSASIAALFYARTQRTRIRSAAVTIDGKSIDSLNLANLRRRTNRSLVIQEAGILAVIDGEDLALTSKYSGYCRASRETTIEFSIDADANIPFERLDCVAFDHRHDPGAEHPIRPVLVGPDGISKKIAVPFQAPLSMDEPFCVLLKCRLPGCMMLGIDYYTATLSFAQETVPRWSVRIQFLGGDPEWVRVYEYRSGKPITLLRDLRRVPTASGAFEYRDEGENIPANLARVYLFSRPYASVHKRNPPGDREVEIAA